MFKTYKRKGLAEIIPLKEFIGFSMAEVSISSEDQKLPVEEFNEGFILRNTKNHNDLWYVSKKYFEENLEELEPKTKNDSITEREGLSVGEKIVRTEFNPSSMGEVSILKTKTAEIINQIDGLRDLDPRLAAIAITKFEEAAMFAVKLATTSKA